MALRTGWYTSGLPGVECRGATYCLRPLDRLPIIGVDQTQEFTWLPNVDRPLDWAITTDSDPGGDQRLLDRVRAKQIALPSSFEAILRAPPRRWALRSMTGCRWTVDSDALRPIPTSTEPTIRFLTDQQGALFWYVLLDGNLDAPVVVSRQDFIDPDTWEPSPLDHVYRTAPSFEAFLYRFWIENEIGFRSIDSEPLTLDQQRYLDDARRLAAEDISDGPNP